MRPSFAATTVLAVLVLLLFPVAASADGRWSIKDTSAHVRGSVTHEANTVNPGFVYNKGGKRKGRLDCTNSDFDSPLWWLRKGSTVVSYRIQFGEYYEGWADKPSGRAIVKAGRLVLQKRVHGKWRSVGTASRSCEADMAIGAARILLW
jgi:hypothetical protein